MRRTVLVGISLLAVGLAAFGGPRRRRPRRCRTGRSHGTTLGLSGGVGKASSDTSAMLGTALGWEINHRVKIEGTDAMRPPTDDAFVIWGYPTDGTRGVVSSAVRD